MVGQADHVEWMVVDTEAEALLLEHNLIKQFQPRYNVRLKDDKSYPWLALTVEDEWPRPAVVRGRKRKRGAVLRPLPERRGHPRDPRPVAPVISGADLLGHQVPATPAPGPPLPAVPHRAVLGPVRRRGRPTTSTTGWWPTSSPSSAATPGRWRRASRRPCGRRRTPSTSSGPRCSGTSSRRCGRPTPSARWSWLGPEDLDVFGLAEDELEAAVQVFHVRSGRVVGRLALFVDKVEDLSTPTADGAGTGRRLRRCGVGGAPTGAGPHHAGRRRGGHRLPDRTARRAGGAAGAGPRGQAGAARDGRAQCRGGLRPPSPAADVGPQQPGPGPRVAPAGAGTARTRRSASSATT